jgi:protein-histidine pros-kinase
METALFDRTFVGSSPENALAFIVNILQSSTEYSLVGKGLDGTILLWNEGARRLYGFEAAEVLGRANSDTLYAPEDIVTGRPRAIMQEALRYGKWEGILRRVRKNGEKFLARAVVTPRFDTSGRHVGYLLISKDVTNETAAAHADEKLRGLLQEKNLELENASLAKDRFLASMSHELRTPLNAILGFTGTLLMKLPGPLTPDQEKQLRTVQAGARQLLSLINDLLDLAKIESGRVELNLEAVACQGVVQEVATALRPLAEAKSLEFEATVSPPELAVRADRRALSQILLNLTNNAIKFTEKGRVRLLVDGHNENGRKVVEFHVSDTGIGIGTENQARLFQAFKQVEAPRRLRQEGTGLGLHLSRKLAELLGGQITLQSKFGKGSTFTLVLKVA